MTSPVPRRLSSGACPGRTPNTPSDPGITTSSASPDTTSRVGVATSSRSRSAIAAGPLLAQPLRLFHGLVDPADHVEGLLRQVVVLALDDLAESADAIGKRNVLSGRPGERLCHEEGLGQEALDLPRARDRALIVLRQL